MTDKIKAAAEKSPHAALRIHQPIFHNGFFEKMAIG